MQEAVVIHLGKPQVLVRQAAQPLQRLRYAYLALPDLFQQLRNLLLLNRGGLAFIRFCT
jgi:hypothetical protein